jgi:hypothetical protein
VTEIDLDTLARRVVQGLDRRAQHAPRQPVTRLATQHNGTVVTNQHRVLNIKSSGAKITNDATNRRANLVIPCGYLPIVIDGGGQAIAPSSKVQTTIPIHDNLQVVQWTLAADLVGSITFDIKSSSYANWPATTSIISGTHPNLTSQQKNKSIDYIDPTTGLVNVSWVPLGWTQLNVGDMIDVLVTSNATITRVTLTLQVQAVS